MVAALVSGASGPGSSLGRGHCVVFLGKTLFSHSASLYPGIQLFREKLSYEWGKAYTTMSKVIMGNGGCLSERQECFSVVE